MQLWCECTGSSSGWDASEWNAAAADGHDAAAADGHDVSTAVIAGVAAVASVLLPCTRSGDRVDRGPLIRIDITIIVVTNHRLLGCLPSPFSQSITCVYIYIYTVEAHSQANQVCE